MTELMPRILCVDDEPNVLAGLERTLFDDYDVTTANSGVEALEILAEEEPFAIIISDMRMPNMDGATFLAEARKLEPDTVRMLLTGYSDVEAAISAINDGQIFRFLCKPCPEQQLRGALSAATQQYALVKAERQLLEDTLNGAVKALTDTLSLAAPLAFQRSAQLQRMIDHMLAQLNEEQPWQYRLAAMLAPIGCITLPTDVVERAYQGKALSDAEKEMLKHHPDAGCSLLEKIPRLGNVARMVAYQNGPSPPSGPNEIAKGAAMLRLANELSAQLHRGVGLGEALIAAERRKVHPRQLLEAMGSYRGEQIGVERTIGVMDLRAGMVVLEDVLAENDSVLIAKGRVVDEILIRRLRNFASGIGVREPFRVQLPTQTAPASVS